MQAGLAQLHRERQAQAERRPAGHRAQRRWAHHQRRARPAAAAATALAAAAAALTATAATATATAAAAAARVGGAAWRRAAHAQLYRGGGR